MDASLRNSHSFNAFLCIALYTRATPRQNAIELSSAGVPPTAQLVLCPVGYKGNIEHFKVASHEEKCLSVLHRQTTYVFLLEPNPCQGVFFPFSLPAEARPAFSLHFHRKIEKKTVSASLVVQRHCVFSQAILAFFISRPQLDFEITL